MLNLEPKSEVFVPEKCKNCKYYIENKPDVIGIRVQTPFSYFLAKGCVSDAACEEKNVQSLFFGVGVDTNIQLFTWELLIGKETFKDEKEKKEFIDQAITVYGGKLKNLEKLEVKVPGTIEKLVKIIIESELPCFLMYPLPREVEQDLHINPVTEELEIIEKPLPAPPDRMFRLNFVYLGSRFSFQKATIYIIEEDDIILHKGLWITTKEDIAFYKKMEYYIEQFWNVVKNKDFNDLNTGIQIGKVLAKYIKQCVIINNKKKKNEKLKKGEESSPTFYD